MERRQWFKLDNAGKLYPAVATSRWSSIFRVSCDLKAPVDAERLQRAADLTLPRFPSLKVRMRRGLFWYYLEEIKQNIVVRPDQGHPCLRFLASEDNGYLMRILYFRDRVSVEYFHALTDGTGGICFMKTLIREYLRLGGADILCDNGALDVQEKPLPEETEDAFRKIPLPRARVSRREAPAYHYPGTREISHTLNLIAADMPCDKVIALAKAQGVTLTEYLVAVFLYCAYLSQRQSGKRRLRTLRVSVPINMRQFLPVATMRNFSTFVNPDIDPRLGEYTFEEIARDVRAFMQYQSNIKFLCATIATNVSYEKNLIMRLAPLFIKRVLISGVFRMAGDRLITTTLTNLGRMKMPSGMEKYASRMDVTLGVPTLPMTACAMVSNGNELRLNFARNIREADMIRDVVRFLVDQGVPVTIQSNEED